MDMSQPHGKGGEPNTETKPTNRNGNGRGRGRPQTQRPPNAQNQPTPNFVSPNAFGPPLGAARARPNQNEVGTPSSTCSDRSEQSLALTKTRPQDRDGGICETPRKWLLYNREGKIFMVHHLIATRDRDQNSILIRIIRNNQISAVQFIQYLQRIPRNHFDLFAKRTLMGTESLLDILKRCYTENRTNWQQAFEQKVLGMIVQTNYNNKTYRISDVIYDATPRSTFETRNNGPISYIEYYQTKRERNITDDRQPLLRAKPTERNIRGARGRDEEAQPINLIPELCTPTGNTDDDMREKFNFTKDVIAVHTRVGQAQRIQKLMAFSNNRLQTDQGSVACFNEWALGLPERKNAMDRNGKIRTENALQGRNTMYSSVELAAKQWAAVVPEALSKDGRAFIQCIQDVSRAMGFNVGDPDLCSVRDDRSTTLDNVLEDVCNRNKKMILILVTDIQTKRYSTIKKVCCLRHAVPSQVVTARDMDSRNIHKMRSVATKVAIQMNSKIGGSPWQVDVELNNCMYIGYDVCHDTKDKTRSFGAVVATIDMGKSTKFFSAATAHTSDEELSKNLALNVVAAIKQYKQIHGTIPERILFYRDGVGEDQIKDVLGHELQNLLRSLKQLYGEQPVKMAFVIVSKRNNTKKNFEASCRGAINVLAPARSVVVDNVVVTLPERYDFFLVPQDINQGTTTPTNYNVIYDTFGLPPDKLQILTHKMCHLCYNLSGTSRVPVVCQYAHKLAFLVGNFLHQSPAKELSPYLYFL